ncbi:DUF4355 domain-containing protein [Anaerococcus sp. AGMB09787]|uniref:DUF4355 domain-containing protein n=1 Tax=Anaerococcus sp. AGMB09787 TaxID=2922869 RepID=UPI001FAF5E85|nr:DUF4355 domain-containing protein [Anaerococcus sp. AGMB09787]
MKNLFLSDIDLQRLAEESTDNASQEQGTDPTNSGDDKNGQEEKEYLKITQEELNNMFDKRLKRQEEKLTKQFEEQLEEEKRQAKLTQAEKEAEEREKKDKELADAKETIRLMQLSNDTSDLLSEQGINQSFKQFLMGKDLEDTKKNVEEFKKTFDEKLQEAVKEKTKGSTPPAGNEPKDPEVGLWSMATNKYK